MFKALMTSLFVVLFNTHLAHAAQTVLQGEHQGESYLIALSDEWEDVNGNWGDNRKYNLAWDSYDFTLKGKTAGIAQNFYYDSIFKEMTLESDCGLTDLKFDFAKNQATGFLCEKTVTLNFSSKADLVEQLSEGVLKELVLFFPEPTKQPIHDFFKPKLVHALNAENANGPRR